MEEKILEINDLKVFDSRSKKEIVKGISFFVNRGECTAIVGESGSGKSISCKTILGLNKFWIENTGKIRFNGEDISNKKPKERRKLCGSKISLILQNGMDAFDPSCKMKVHFRESLKANFAMSRADADALMINVMKSVMLKDPEDILEKYPHQLSGGMLQRCMIALSIALKPELIIADEPTTALDMVTQYEVVSHFIELRKRENLSMIFISHDLAIVKKIADFIVILKDGELVESGSTYEIFNAPKHEFTKFLIDAKNALNNAMNEKFPEREIYARSL